MFYYIFLNANTNTWMIDTKPPTSSVLKCILDEKGFKTQPLLKRGKGDVTAIVGQMTICLGATLAIDEKFSVEMPNNTKDSLEIFVNEECTCRSVFNEKFKSYSSEVGDHGFGLYAIEVKQNGRALSQPLLIERYPGYKIGYDFCGRKESCPVKRYDCASEFFRKMTDSLRDSNMAFSLLDPASFAKSAGDNENQGSKSVDRTKAQPRTELTDYWFFVKHAETIKRSLRHIRRIPHKVLGHNKEYLRIDKVTQYTSDLPYEISKAPQYFQGPTGNGIVKSNNGNYTPEKVLVSILEETYDNPENRFILHIIEIFLAKLRRVEEYLPVEKKKQEISNLMKTLKMFKRHPDFRQVQRSPLEPKQSKVLTKTPGYKDIAKIWRQYGGLELNEGLQFLETLVRQKKWHELYELWCFQLLLKKFNVSEDELNFWTKYIFNKSNSNEPSSYLTSTVVFEKNGTFFIFLYQPTIMCEEEDEKCAYYDLNGNEECITIKTGASCNNGKIRPDFLLLKKTENVKNECEPVCILDAKFIINQKLSDDIISCNVDPCKDCFKENVLSIEKKYLKRFSGINGCKLPGCGIFLSNGEEVEPVFNVLHSSRDEKVNYCVSAITVDGSDDLKITCNKCEYTKKCHYSLLDMFNNTKS